MNGTGGCAEILVAFSELIPGPSLRSLHDNQKVTQSVNYNCRLKQVTEYVRETVIALSADCVSTNDAVHRHLSNFLRAAILLLHCMSHTLNNAGEKVGTPTADKYFKARRKMLGTSNVAKNAYAEAAGKKAQGYSATRWGSDASQKSEALENGLDCEVMLVETMELRKLCDKTAATMGTILNEPKQRYSLQVELFGVQWLMLVVVTSLYRLESDQAVSLVAFKILNEVTNSLRRGIPDDAALEAFYRKVVLDCFAVQQGEILQIEKQSATISEKKIAIKAAAAKRAEQQGGQAVQRQRPQRQVASTYARSATDKPTWGLTSSEVRDIARLDQEAAGLQKKLKALYKEVGPSSILHDTRPAESNLHSPCLEL